MIRAFELSLFVLPFVLFFVWRRTVATGLAPSRGALLVLLAGLIALGGGLAWTGLRERHREGSRYIPAQMEGGRVVPGHGA
ncbi:MAG: hypothetical protein RQ966_07510 [Acetobacteraceae bacterium]|nr:hypothetical protein [Acetobacteraceae bacterium]